MCKTLASARVTMKIHSKQFKNLSIMSMTLIFSSMIRLVMPHRFSGSSLLNCLRPCFCCSNMHEGNWTLHLSTFKDFIADSRDTTIPTRHIKHTAHRLHGNFLAGNFVVNANDCWIDGSTNQVATGQAMVHIHKE